MRIESPMSWLNRRVRDPLTTGVLFIGTVVPLGAIIVGCAPQDNQASAQAQRTTSEPTASATLAPALTIKETQAISQSVDFINPDLAKNGRWTKNEGGFYTFETDSGLNTQAINVRLGQNEISLTAKINPDALPQSGDPEQFLERDASGKARLKLDKNSLAALAGKVFKIPPDTVWGELSQNDMVHGYWNSNGTEIRIHIGTNGEAGMVVLLTR